MYDIMATAWNFQVMAMRSASSVAASVMEMQLQLIETQLGLLDHVHAHRRATDPKMAVNPKARKRRATDPKMAVNPKARKRRGIKAHNACCGPDLHDHYGHRAQDVDVEHL